MKVLIVTTEPYPHVGGASTHIGLLASVLKRRGELAGIVSRIDAQITKADRARHLMLGLVNRDGERVRYLQMTADRIAQAIRVHLRDSEDLLIHSHDALATKAALMAVRGRVVVVQTVHGPWSRELIAVGVRERSRGHAMVRAVEAEAFARANLLLPVDEGQAAILREDFGVAPERYRVIENAVDIEAITASNGAPPPGLPDNFMVVPRRLAPKNGVEFAVRAMPYVRTKDLHIVVAGDGLLRRPLEKLSQKLGVTGRVLFLGDVPHDSLLGIVRKSKAVIVPSVPADGVTEATSLAVLEGMAAQVPVIGSAIGGIRDIIRNSSCGFLVPPGDPEALAQAIDAVLALSPSDAADLSHNALERVREGFSVDVWERKVVAAYAVAKSLQGALPR